MNISHIDAIIHSSKLQLHGLEHLNHLSERFKPVFLNNLLKYVGTRSIAYPYHFHITTLPSLVLSTLLCFLWIKKDEISDLRGIKEVFAELIKERDGIGSEIEIFIKENWLEETVDRGNELRDFLKSQDDSGKIPRIGMKRKQSGNSQLLPSEPALKKSKSEVQSEIMKQISQFKQDLNHLSNTDVVPSNFLEFLKSPTNLEATLQDMELYRLPDVLLSQISTFLAQSELSLQQYELYITMVLVPLIKTLKSKASRSCLLSFKCCCEKTPQLITKHLIQEVIQLEDINISQLEVLKQLPIRNEDASSLIHTFGQLVDPKLWNEAKIAYLNQIMLHKSNPLQQEHLTQLFMTFESIQEKFAKSNKFGKLLLNCLKFYPTILPPFKDNLTNLITFHSSSIKRTLSKHLQKIQ